MELARYQGQGEIDQIVKEVIEGIENSAMTAELLQKVEHHIGGQKVFLLGFEKFFYRSSNRGMLTIMILENEYDQICVDVISGGTSQGVFFKFDWGASKSFIKTVENVMSNMGFSKTS